MINVLQCNIFIKSDQFFSAYKFFFYKMTKFLCSTEGYFCIVHYHDEGFMRGHTLHVYAENSHCSQGPYTALYLCRSPSHFLAPETSHSTTILLHQSASAGPNFHFSTFHLRLVQVHSFSQRFSTCTFEIP